MTLVKICGIRRSVDIEYVNELCPDYAGFVFARSRRQVGIRQAQELIGKLRPEIKAVGVFVNEDINAVKETADYLKLKVLQFHGEETQDYLDNFEGYEIWKAVGITGMEDLKRVDSYSCDAVLLDSKAEGMYGGTGLAFKWELALNSGRRRKIVLAGGLNSGNVRQAIEKVCPYAVDISSGVEIDGIKDYLKMKEFIDEVRG